MNIEDIDTNRLNRFYEAGEFKFVSSKKLEFYRFFNSQEIQNRLLNRFTESDLIEILEPQIADSGSLEELATIYFNLTLELRAMSRKYTPVKQYILTTIAQFLIEDGREVTKNDFIKSFGAWSLKFSRRVFTQAFKNVYGLDIPEPNLFG